MVPSLGAAPYCVPTRPVVNWGKVYGQTRSEPITTPALEMTAAAEIKPEVVPVMPCVSGKMSCWFACAIFSPIQQRQRRAMVFAPALGRDRGLAQCLRDRRSAPDGFRVELRTFLVADNSLAAQRLADSADRWPSRLND